jgi:WD40 repeat protein
MDKTVRLWHLTLDECLRVFDHNDFVTTIDFNPVNDKYFISGSLDGLVRLWYIPGHRVADYVKVNEMVTAATFSPDARKTVAGS